MKTYTAEKVFKTAAQFHTASIYISSSGLDGKRKMASAMVVNQAFAVELYFKSLILDQTGSPATGHGLVELFNKVDPATQADIHMKYDILRSEDPTRSYWEAPKPAGAGRSLAFVDVLNDGDKAFQQWRYFHEYFTGGAILSWFGGALAEATRLTILEIHPDWRKHSEGIMRPPTSQLQ